MIFTIFLFIIAGIAEIGGGYLIWLWLREGKPFYLGIFGVVALTMYGIIATFQSFTSFGRIFAAYGGISSFCPFYGDGELIRRHLIFTTGSVQVFV